MPRYRYSVWEEASALPSSKPEELFDALMNDFLPYGDLQWALSELLRRGYRGQDGEQLLAGFDDILQALEEQKHQVLQHYAADAFQLSPQQVAQLQSQLDMLVARTVEEQAALQTLAQAVRDKLQERQWSMAPQETPDPWRPTEVARQLHHTLSYPESALASQDRAVAQTLQATLQAVITYLEVVDHLEQQWLALPFCGAAVPSLTEAQRLLRALQALDALEKKVRWGERDLLALSDAELLALLPPELRQHIQQLQHLEQQLTAAGLVKRTARGLQLTTRGLHRIGASVFRTMFQRSTPQRRSGSHAASRYGRRGPLTGTTHPYVFGDTVTVHLERTLTNAVLRRPGLPVHLRAEDFEIYDTETLTQNATVIMLDMSHSMELFGRQRFTAAKKVALALAHLLRTRFPRDVLHIVGFGDTARQLDIHELPYVTVGHEHTNTQEGLRLARTLLSRQRSAQKHIVLITDGRPTAAHFHGELYQHTLGLHPLILEETYKEAWRCRQLQMTLNTFMIAEDEPLVQFVKRLTSVSQGRAFYTSPERLGEYVIDDYLRRSRHVF